MKYIIVAKFWLHIESNPMIQGHTTNLYHCCTSRMIEKLQNSHVFYLYGAIFGSNKVYMSKGHPNERIMLNVDLSSQWYCQILVYY